MLGMLGPLSGGMDPTGGLTNGAGSPISSSASATTGDQTTNSNFTGGSVSFGSGNSNNNQLMIIGAVVLVGLFLLKKK